MRTCVSGNFGGYEQLKAAPAGIRSVFFTDQDVTDPNGWEIVRRRADHGLSKYRHFFVAKLVPHIVVSDDDDVIWIDGSFEPTGRDVNEMFDLVPPGGVGLYRHREFNGNRIDCFDCEARFSQWYGKDHERAAMSLEQAEHYKARGCPVHWGHWNSGIIVWRGAQRSIGERWFAETMAWSASDQMALPYVLHVLGLGREAITEIGDNVYACPWFDYVHHGQRGRTTK